MKRKILFFLLLITVILVYPENKLNIGGGKIVKVNNYIITEDELNSRYSILINNIQPGVQRPTKKDVLNELISAQLVSDELKNHKEIIINEDDFNKSVNQMQSLYNNQKKIENPNYIFKEADFKNFIETEYKITYEKYIQTIREKLLFDKFLQKKLEPKMAQIKDKKYNKPADFPVKDISTGDKYNSVKEFYEMFKTKYFVEDQNIKLKHIFLAAVEPDGKGGFRPLSNDKKLDQKKKIDDLYNRIKKGDAKFEDLCTYSEDIDSKNYVDPATNVPNYGYIGPVYFSGQHVNDFKKLYGENAYNQMAAFEKGKYYLVESVMGYHIFYVVDKKDTRIIPFEEAQSQIIMAFRNMDMQSIYQNELTNTINDLKKKANIVYYVDEYKPK